MIPSNIRGRIILAKLWVLSANPGMSVEQAEKIAAMQVAKEVAAERRQQRQQRKPSLPQDSANPRDRLLARIFSILDRQDEAARRQDAARRHTEPSSNAAPISGELALPTSPAVVRKAEPAPGVSIVGVWTGDRSE